MAYVQLENATKKMKCWVDHDRLYVEFKVGDLILLKMDRKQFKPPSNMDGALLWRFQVSLKVLQNIGNVTYRLELSAHMRAHHLVFHINQLKPIRIDK
jgi:hypothetical protein